MIDLARFFSLDFLLGLGLGVSFVTHCWASEKAFGKWWMGMAILAGYRMESKHE